jgi:glycosyltransferase involved in cell wall biosynthesis
MSIQRNFMKLSIVIPVLDSHEILRRQMLHFEQIGIPEDTEIIIMDDGSEPPLRYEGKLPVTIHATNDKRPWTWALARNAGARMAKGEYLLMFDIDHIITKELLDAVRLNDYQKMHFSRQFGVLLEDGTFTQDRAVLEQYGLPKERELSFGPLPNNFAMCKDIFFELGGYREDLIGRPYPQGEDSDFKKKWHRWIRAGKGDFSVVHPIIYMFPNGKFCGDVDYNPDGLFHSLSRKNK